MVTIKELAIKYGMTTIKARRILRDSGIKRKKPQWKWKEGTKGLQAVEDLLIKYQEFTK